MDYRSSTLRRALAAEYVVGSMTPLTRKRFERLLVDDPLLAAEVTAWEDTLYESIDLLPSDHTPRAAVWERITADIGFDSAPAVAPVVVDAPAPIVQTPPPKPSDLRATPEWWRMLGLWQGTTAIAMAASVVLGLMLFTQSPQPLPVPYIAVLGTAENRVGWLVRAEARKGASPLLTVRSISEHTLAPDQSFQVWLLPGPGQGDAPRSIGFAPATGELSQEVSEELLRLLPDAAGLAVSLEPSGGSPTGAPTGPVLVQSI